MTTPVGRLLVPLLAVVSLLLGTVPATAGPTVPGRQGSRDLLAPQVTTTRYFSPDGDGVQDSVKVRFGLLEWSRIRIEVRRATGTHRTVRTVSLGKVGPGLHIWTWKGRNDRHRVTPDGDWDVVVIASRGRKGSSHRLRDTVRTTVSSQTTWGYPPDWNDRGGEYPYLRITRDTVYPASTDLTDQIDILSRDPYTPISLDESWSTTIEPPLRIVDADGRAVFAQGARQPTAADPSTAWTGRDQNGDPLPPGRYTLVIRHQDFHGNRKWDRIPLTVSGAKLVAQPAWRTTVGADAALLVREPATSCSEEECVTICPPRGSSRVTGGVTYVAWEAANAAAGRRCTDLQASFGVPLPFSLDSRDLVTITVTGAEYPAGSTGSVSFGTIGSDSVDWPQTRPGVPTTTIGPVRPGVDAIYDTDPDQLTWRSYANLLQQGQEYDVASFDVEVIHYVPVG